jgi:hypothetical protein
VCDIDEGGALLGSILPDLTALPCLIILVSTASPSFARIGAQDGFGELQSGALAEAALLTCRPDGLVSCLRADLKTGMVLALRVLVRRRLEQRYGSLTLMLPPGLPSSFRHVEAEPSRGRAEEYPGERGSACPPGVLRFDAEQWQGGVHGDGWRRRPSRSERSVELLRERLLPCRPSRPPLYPCQVR